jgi:hypothetical protein
MLSSTTYYRVDADAVNAVMLLLSAGLLECRREILIRSGICH